MKTAILSLVLAGGVAGLSVQQIRTQRQLHQAQVLLQQQSETLHASQGLQERLAAQRDELQQVGADKQELVRLRGEVARLRRESASVPRPAPAQTASKAPELTTNAPTSSVLLSSKFVLLPSEDLKVLNVAWNQNPEGNVTALLNQDQFQAINQALEGAGNVKMLGSPRLATRSGREARLFAGPNFSGASAGSGEGGGGAGSFEGGSGTGGSSRTFAPTTNASPGMTLSVLPYFTEETSSFDLQLTAGFSQWTDRSPQQDGKEPQFTQAKVHLVMGTGQTAILAKEVPNEGWTEADNTVPGPKTLLVFITPSIVQTANRLQNIINKVPR